MRNPDLMTPTEVIETVVRAAEKATQQIYTRLPDGPRHFDKNIIDADIFIQALKDELL